MILQDQPLFIVYASVEVQYTSEHETFVYPLFVTTTMEEAQTLVNEIDAEHRALTNKINELPLRDPGECNDEDYEECDHRIRKLLDESKYFRWIEDEDQGDVGNIEISWLFVINTKVPA